MQGTNEHRNVLVQRREKRILAAAHRGNCRSGFVDNTIPAMMYTLNKGADILELDVIASTEGELFIFHSGLEEEYLHEKVDLEKLCSREIRERRLYDSSGKLTEQGLDTLEDVLRLTKDRCVLNLDRCDRIFPLVKELIKKHQMENQVLLKCVPRPENLDRMEQGDPAYMFMPIMRYNLDGLEDALSRNLQVVGIELTFDDVNMVSEDKMKAWHEKGYLLWCNSLNLTGRTLNAEHDDHHSLAGQMEKGWGWLVNRGFDIIQTDYTSELVDFLNIL